MVGLLVTALVALALLGYVGVVAGRSALGQHRDRARHSKPAPQPRIDPGVERRAELRARSLLRSVVNRDDWEMYRDLGFMRIVGRMSEGTDGRYCYLIYPHKPIVAYLPDSDSLLSEYCVAFPDRSEGIYGPRLPDSDDVLAKWMMIQADEEQLVRGANMHLPGRQVDPQQVRRDLVRLREWERAGTTRSRQAIPEVLAASAA